MNIICCWTPLPFGVAIALEPRLAGVAEVVHGKAGAP